MGDGQGLIPLTLRPHPIGPDGVGQMGPIVLTLAQFLPGAFEFGLPLSQAEEFPQGGSGDLYPIVEVGLPGELGDAQQFIAELDEF